MARRFAVALALAMSFAGPPATAQPAPAESGDDATARATPHFTNGVKLFQEGNFVGALAEFEEAYRLKPGASSLRNVALCQKQLFRYAQAADTLETLLEKHAGELDPEDRKKVEAAVLELNALVGTLTITVEPPNAVVRLDGKRLDAEERKTPVRVNVGEHTLTVEAEGFMPHSETLRVSGRQAKAVKVDLRPVTGLVVVTTRNEDDAIAVDGQARAYGSWRGRLAPGRHLVQVYRDGFQQYEYAFEVEVGKTVEVAAPELEATDEDAPETPGALPSPKQTGWYVLGTLGLMVPADGTPDNHQHGNGTDANGGSIGVRGGYRIWRPVAVELMLDASRQTVDGACVGLGVENPCAVTTPERRDYTISSVRLGGNIRYTSNGRKVRFAATAGVGAVGHVVDLDPSVGPNDTTGQFSGGEGSGLDPYFLAELGAQFNVGHALLEASVAFLLEATDGIKGEFDNGPRRKMYTEDALASAGLVLKAGWSQWRPAPKRTSKPPPPPPRTIRGAKR